MTIDFNTISDSLFLLFDPHLFDELTNHFCLPALGTDCTKLKVAFFLNFIANRGTAAHLLRGQPAGCPSRDICTGAVVKDTQDPDRLHVSGDSA